jgi:hypothetical protein
MSDLSLEKMKISDRLTSLEITNTQMIVKMDALIKSNDTIGIILTGNGHPESGLSFRVKEIEAKEIGKKQNSKALWTFLSSLGVLVMADWIHRFFSSHK